MSGDPVMQADQPAPATTELMPKQLIDFLMGEAAVDGIWFDELRASGRVWWRALIAAARRANAAQAEPESAPEPDGKNGVEA